MRPIHVTHSALPLAPPSFMPAHGAPAPADPRSSFARAAPGNLVAEPLLPTRLPPGPGRTLLWSGWFEPDQSDGDLPSPLTWSPAAWTRLTTFCAAVAESRSDARVCFVPRSGHILSDLPSCQRFLGGRAGWTGAHADRFELLLDPIGMLSLDMLVHAPEHLERIVLGLGGLAGVAGIFLSNVAPVSLERRPIHDGVLSAPFLAELLSRCPADLPLLLLNEDVAGQLRGLELAGGD